MKSILIFLCVAAAAHAQQHDTALFRASAVALRAAIAADAITTEAALSRPGIREANPLQRNRAVRIGTHAAVGVLLPVLERRYMRQHPKAAALLNFGLAAGFAAISGSNIQLARFGK